MNKISKIKVLFLALCLMIPCFASVKSSAKQYTYTVRLYSGAQGTLTSTSGVTVTDAAGKAVSRDISINGNGTCITISKLHLYDRVTFSQSMIKLLDSSKYTVKGFREAGKDNNTSSIYPSFRVTEDADYVVAYKLLSNAVAYTVRYVDEQGNSLAPDETYYGNVGDRPVVAFAYIEGYTPASYNMTGTLKADASQNVFTFVYYTATEEEEENGGENGNGQGNNGQNNNGQNNNGQNNNGQNGQGNNGQNGNNGQGNNGNNQGNNGNGQGNNGQNGNNGNGQGNNGNGGQEIIDIDPNNTPLTPGDFSKFIGNLPLEAKAGLIALIILVAGLLIRFFVLKDKEEEDDEKA